MKSIEFTVGLSMRLSGRKLELLLKEQGSGWIKITLCDEKGGIFLSESIYTKKSIRSQKVIDKLKIKIDKLEDGYNNTKAKSKMLTVLKQSKKIIENL